MIQPNSSDFLFSWNQMPNGIGTWLKFITVLPFYQGDKLCVVIAAYSECCIVYLGCLKGLKVLQRNQRNKNYIDLSCLSCQMLCNTDYFWYNGLFCSLCHSKSRLKVVSIQAQNHLLYIFVHLIEMICWSLHQVTACVTVCAFPYILAFTTDSIEIRLVVNGNLVYTAVVPELHLIASRVKKHFLSYDKMSV